MGSTFFFTLKPSPKADEIEAQMVAYCERVVNDQLLWPQVMRHMLGLMHEQAGARKWRQVWSDHHDKHLAVAQIYAKIQQFKIEYSENPIAFTNQSRIE